MPREHVVGLAKPAKVFGIPTVLTTVLKERGGLLIQQLQDVFPDQKPINRTFINAWQNERVVDAVTATGRKKLIIAGLYTEICVAMPTQHMPLRTGLTTVGHTGVTQRPGLKAG